MLNPFKNFEKMNFERLDDIVENILSENKTDFEYYEYDIVEDTDMFFQLYLDNDISYECYKKYESYIISFILSLARMSSINAIVSLRGLVYKNKAAKKSSEYYRKFKYMEKQFKKPLHIPQKYVEVTSIIGLREIGLVSYYFKDISLIMLIDSLRGYLIFEKKCTDFKNSCNCP